MVKHDENIHCKCWYTVYPIFGQLHLGVATIRCMAPSYLCHRVAFSIQHSHFWRMRKELSNQKIDFGKHCSTLGSHHFWRVQSGCALRERIHFNYLQLVSISRRKITFQTVSHHFHHVSHVFPCFPMFSHLPKMFPTVLPPFSLHITGTSGSGTDLSSRATSPASQEETDPTSQQMATLCAELCADSEATGYQIHANTLICIYIICVYIIFICT